MTKPLSHAINLCGVTASPSVWDILFTTLDPLNLTCLLFQPPLGYPLMAPVSSTYTSKLLPPKLAPLCGCRAGCLGTHLVPTNLDDGRVNISQANPQKLGASPSLSFPRWAVLRCISYGSSGGPSDPGTSDHCCRQLCNTAFLLSQRPHSPGNSQYAFHSSSACSSQTHSSSAFYRLTHTEAVLAQNDVLA